MQKKGRQPKEMKTDAQTGAAQKEGAQRELTKASAIMSFDKSLSMQDDGKKYDQFAGKKSTYKETDYTTAIDESKVTEKQRASAQALEDDILNKGRKQEADVGHDDNDQQLAMQEDEEMKFSGVIRDQEAPAQPKPTNLKSRDQYIKEFLKKSQEERNAR